MTQVPATASATLSASAAPSASPAPTPSPVSTAATLASKCVTGFVTVNPETGQAVSFVPFSDVAGFSPGPNVHGGYQVTLTNTSASTAEVTGFSVVFYSGGAETGSADAGPFDTFITPGQSLTWTKTTTVMNVGQNGGVDTSATCALVQWDRP